jgi:hypothetical protein
MLISKLGKASLLSLTASAFLFPGQKVQAVADCEFDCDCWKDYCKNEVCSGKKITKFVCGFNENKTQFIFECECSAS